MTWFPLVDSPYPLLAHSELLHRIAEWTAVALLHFLWQGSLLAFALAVLLKFFRDLPGPASHDHSRLSRAAIRYRICCAGLVAMSALPVANYLWISTHSSPAKAWDSTANVARGLRKTYSDGVSPVAIDDSNWADAPPADQATNSAAVLRESSPTSSRSVRGAEWMQSIPLKLVFWSWLIGVISLSMWHMTSWSVSRRLTKNTADVPTDLAQMFTRSKTRLGLGHKQIELRVSLEAWAPMVVGWFRPVILLPVSVLTALTPHEMESILIHELAHVRRHDYTMNLLQVAVETVLFFHPSVWWLSRRIRVEREYRADDVAVQFGAGPEVYVHSLLRIAETCRSQPQTVTVAATGGSLADRAARLLGVTTEANQRRHRAGNALLALAIGISVTLFGVAGMLTLRADDEKKSQDEEAEVEEPIKVAPAPWGSIRGRFVWDGVIPDLPKLRNTRDVVALGESVVDESLLVDPKTRGVKNIAIYVRDKRLPVHPGYVETAKDMQSFTYKGSLSPRVQSLRTTQKLQIANRDAVAHSALFDPLFNEGQHVLVPANAELKLNFPVAERVPMRVRDAIHPWITAHLIVTDHPYVAITDKDGNFELKNLPAQEVELQFWHEKTGFLVARPHWERGRKKLTVRAGETLDLGDVVVPTAAFGIQAIKEPALEVGHSYVVILDNGIVRQGVLAAENKETIRLLSDDKFMEIDRENIEGIRARKR